MKLSLGKPFVNYTECQAVFGLWYIAFGSTEKRAVKSEGESRGSGNGQVTVE